MSSSVFEDKGWWHWHLTEEELEELLLTNLEILYTVAINKLVEFGYGEEEALNAILENGHCCDLRQLREYSLMGSVSFLQLEKPHLTKDDALWSILMSVVNVGNASAMEIALQREIECPKRFNLSPSMKCMLKRDVMMFAAGFGGIPKRFQWQSQACPSSLSGGCGTAAAVPVGNSVESQCAKTQDVVNSVVSKFLNTGKVSLDEQDFIILILVHQITCLKKQVKERKEWAQQKAIQAAKKLSRDFTELRKLRMEREGTRRLKKGRKTFVDTTLKKVTEMENAVKMVRDQVDDANGVVKKLETKIAEIRAEMEAYKLSSSESVSSCLEVEKREKRCLKRLLAREKQKTKMQEDIAAAKQKISELQEELAQVEEATKETEAKWRQEQQAKELVFTQLENERRLKEASKANNKTRLDDLCRKKKINFQHHKDDLQRLEQEYDCLNESAQLTEVDNDFWTEDTRGDAIGRLMHEADKLQDSSKKVRRDRVCVICTKDEVSVVFLPCTHQVICANCNDNYGKKGKDTCAYCGIPIEQRIQVVGASS
ncbi:MND1-interacting protein 1-like isoform X2 [Salvia hispanica]|uniref:MND1-interacting protein 1-like isoform X2 n=1 Tax=Salvia hispanica TaxID=49212 RepID=UPI002008FA91|nr:MND1-interacting protein 1-like isoform X2 [Salvia hispanica]